MWSFGAPALLRLGCVCALLGAGCGGTAGGYATPRGANPAQDPQARTGAGSVNHEIAAAKRYMDEGRYSQVLPRLINVASRYPDNPEAAAAHYYMGVAYARIGGYQDAQRSLQTYLNTAPEGPFAAAAREEIRAIEAALGAEFVSQEDLDRMAREAALKLNAEGGDLAQQLLVADLLWKQGKYAEAGALYEGLARRQPKVLDDVTVRERIERKPDGSYVLLTPEELLRRAADAEPLLIYGAQSYESAETRGDLRHFENDRYHVSGNVVNQSQREVREAEVLVTIYGFGSRIFDTQAFPLGTMRPGEHRAFSVRFENFDNVDNVQRFECQTRYRD